MRFGGDEAERLDMLTVILYRQVSHVMHGCMAGMRAYHGGRCRVGVVGDLIVVLEAIHVSVEVEELRDFQEQWKV